jgi:tRNA (mo5U34)-methyltransferase
MAEARFMTRPPAAIASGLAAEAAKLAPWFHNLHLPDGSQTAPNHPLGDFPAFKWTQIAPALPADLEGWTALDIGCNAGFYSFELARRGARVVGIDVDPHFLRQARWAAEQFELQDAVEFRQAQVYELAHLRDRYDLVLFLGVFYHLRYPLLALDIVAERVNRRMVFQTLTIPGSAVVDVPPDQDFDDREPMLAEGWPKMAFIEKKLAGDPTNWWAPNHAGVEAMLRSTGLRVIARPGHEIYLCEPYEGARQWDVAELDAACGRAPTPPVRAG